MTLKRSKPACGDRTGSGIAKLASFNSEYPTFWTLSQGNIDAATLLAARFRIAPETAKACVDAFGFGGSR